MAQPFVESSKMSRNGYRNGVRNGTRNGVRIRSRLT
jgi:hypothetical protein